MWHLRGQNFGYYSCPYFSLSCPERGRCKFESRSDRGDLNIKKCIILAPKMTQKGFYACSMMQCNCLKDSEEWCHGGLVINWLVEEKKRQALLSFEMATLLGNKAILLFRKKKTRMGQGPWSWFLLIRDASCLQPKTEAFCTKPNRRHYLALSPRWKALSCIKPKTKGAILYESKDERHYLVLSPRRKATCTMPMRRPLLSDKFLERVTTCWADNFAEDLRRDAD